MTPRNATANDERTLATLGPGERALLEVPAVGCRIAHLPDVALEDLIIVTTASPACVEAGLEDRGVDPADVSLVPIRDSSTSVDATCWATDPVTPDDLTGVSVRLAVALDRCTRPGSWLLFDATEALALFANADRLGIFLDNLVENMERNDVRGVATVTPGALDADALAVLRDRFATVTY